MAASLVAAFAAFVVQSGGDWLWKIPALVALAIIAAAAAIAGASEPQRAPRLRVRGVAFAGAAILAGALMIPGIVSTELVRDSATLLAARSSANATDYARAAVDAEPWSATAYTQLALSERRGHRLRSAQRAARRAVDLEPQSPEHHLLLGVIDFQLGEATSAAAEIRQAAVLDSRNPGPITPASVVRSLRNAPLQRFSP
jgi:Flp pilus assembly protein TadD